MQIESLLASKGFSAHKMTGNNSGEIYEESALEMPFEGGSRH